ncbi:hypothetical protein [Natrinema sp. DC36]|uniref:hypothetical protein n=1 Tax=Natrinema sp. DC36 TaxID=2878680 RepID=UPI001CF0BE04|nr:hypothetical protein [Natrinema sp. DC36]
MNRFNRFPSEEYSEFVDVVQEYTDADHEPGEDVLRALADALEDHLREGFKRRWGVDEAADTACIRREITGADECECGSTSARSWIHREQEAVGGRDDPPHAAPHSDHATLWLDDGEPVLYSMHISMPEIQSVSRTAAPDGETIRNGWFDIFEFAQHWGLEVGVTPWSHYHAFSRTNVVLYSPEWMNSPRS